MRLTISLAQMNIKSGKPDLNITTAIKMIKDAGSVGSDLILLPELWNSGYDLTNAHKYASQAPELLNELRSKAFEFKICIAGSILEGDNSKYLNSFFYITKTGDIYRDYKKIHLFRLMDEHSFLAGGETLHLRKFEWGLCGQAICYDLRFPEIFRSYALNGAKIIFLPAEWPLKRSTHWKTLIRARAIENQLFIIAVNSVGKTGAETFGGNSAVISPWGDAIVEADEKTEQLLTASIDLDEVDRIRDTIPVFIDRRPEIYNSPPIIE